MYELGIETGETFEFYGNGHHSIWRYTLEWFRFISEMKPSDSIFHLFSVKFRPPILSHTRHDFINSYFHVTPSSSVFSNDYFFANFQCTLLPPQNQPFSVISTNGNWSLVFPYSDNSFDTPSIKWMTIDKSYVLPCWILGQAKHSFWFWC